MNTAFGYSKAIIRPIPDLAMMLKDYFKTTEKTQRKDVNASFFRLFIDYFSPPIHIDTTLRHFNHNTTGKDSAAFGKLYLGNIINASNYEQLKYYKITKIYNITSEIRCYFKHLTDEFQYNQYTIKDVKNAAFNTDEFKIMLQQLRDDIIAGHNVLVHCHHGRSRSVTLITGYIMKFYNLTADHAYACVKHFKNSVNINQDLFNQLQSLQDDLN